VKNAPALTQSNGDKQSSTKQKGAAASGSRAVQGGEKKSRARIRRATPKAEIAVLREEGTWEQVVERHMRARGENVLETRGATFRNRKGHPKPLKKN